jgi:hypothetical protein
MKFLCVPCDSPMQLLSVGPPERGSLSVVYSCPECGYEIAMLTNAYETQIVQSLGVRIGSGTATDASATRCTAAALPRNDSRESGGTTASGCPFAAMIPSLEGEGGVEQSTLRHGGNPDPTGALPTDAVPIRWTAAAEARLDRVPAFVRPMARDGIERFARERGVPEIDEAVLDAAREFFGM